MPHGSVIKALAIYDEPFWRADGLSGNAVNPDLPVGFAADYTPPDGSPGVMGAFLAGRDAEEARQLNSPERRQVVLDPLETVFGPRATKPSDYHEVDWTGEEFTRGCFGGFMPPALGLVTERRCASRWATSTGLRAEASEVWMGYMDGAVRSGERAAQQLVAD